MAIEGGSLIVTQVIGKGSQEIIKRTLPIGIQAVRNWFGKTIIIAGDTGAGKTHFITYLQSGALLYEDEHKRTRTENRSRSFNLSLGQDSSLEIIIKTAVEIPGQRNPEQQALTVGTLKPQGVLIFIDMLKPTESFRWLEQFCDVLEDYWRGYGNDNIESIIFVMNKKDKVNQDTLNSYKVEIANKIINKLNFARGEIPAYRIHTMSCVCVINPDRTKYIDAVISRLIMDFAGL